MAKKLIFNAAQTTAAKNEFIDSMQDITFNMTKSTIDIDIEMSQEEQAIKQSLLNALHLQKGGNVLFPEKGAPLIDMLFNTNTPLNEQEVTLRAFIESNEPRISIKALSIAFTTNEYNERIATVDIKYAFLSAMQQYSLTIDLLANGK